MRDEIGQRGELRAEFPEHRRQRPGEHAGVPAVIAAVEEDLGEFRRGFFAEAVHAEKLARLGSRFLQRHRLAHLDVAEPGAGPGGLDADGDERARVLGGGGGGGEVALEGGGVADDVVGGQQ